jgi:hypothetical protein
MRRLALVLLAALAACSWSPKYYPEEQHQSISLSPGDLEAGGIAFITPSTVTGQEQEKQAVAFTFAQVLKRERATLRVVPLAETLGAINSHALAESYRRMYEEYRESGLFAAEVLRRVAAATGVRYVAQLKLQGFSQGSKNRFGLLGFRVADTQLGDVRLLLQVWDAQRGSIAWEGLQELRIAVDTTSEEPITLRQLLERAARDLVARLP